ncbi:GNAT domain-containing protein [Crucibulum laeve]|uniref:GNAT domain-containing protein n=1 Tax=Crucibulum laeve TaxID=68775 RepID=A0A5C3MLD7_9AGAR|nr:GNAT domain-containing protein [Crucibulum laeve]
MVPNHQLHPLEINPTTAEPFLRLRNHPNIILTPPRYEDVPHEPALMNHEKVHVWLEHPPYPYTLEHAKQWLDTIKPSSDALFAELEAARDQEALILTHQCPVRCIREVKEDGTDVFIGDIGFTRFPNGEFIGTDGVDWENKERNVKENEQRQLGDPEIIWSIGDLLAPSHHGQGIMTDAVGTLMHEWAIPRMGVRHIMVSACIGNEGSVKVFLKNGFKLIRTSEDHHEVKGKRVGLHVLEWRAGDA